jgi:uncharacterized membrane protein YobD (UPF0266 family)
MVILRPEYGSTFCFLKIFAAYDKNAIDMKNYTAMQMQQMNNTIIDCYIYSLTIAIVINENDQSSSPIHIYLLRFLQY